MSDIEVFLNWKGSSFKQDALAFVTRQCLWKNIVKFIIPKFCFDHLNYLFIDHFKIYSLYSSWLGLVKVTVLFFFSPSHSIMQHIYYFIYKKRYQIELEYVTEILFHCLWHYVKIYMLQWTVFRGLMIFTRRNVDCIRFISQLMFWDVLF